MSLTAPIKPTPPTVPAVTLHPVESSSQNTDKTELPVQKQTMAENSSTTEKPAKTEKPAVSEKTEPAAKNTTIINKVEPNDQNKIPLLNGATNHSESTNAQTNVAADAPPAAPGKAGSSGLEIYLLAIVAAVLVGGIVLFFRKKVPRKAERPFRTADKRQKSKPSARESRTVIDYSAEHTQEILDLLTSPADLSRSQETANPQTRGSTNKQQEIKSNFEFRV
jgi:hypothetical protein